MEFVRVHDHAVGRQVRAPDAFPLFPQFFQVEHDGLHRSPLRKTAGRFGVIIRIAGYVFEPDMVRMLMQKFHHFGPAGQIRAFSLRRHPVADRRFDVGLRFFHRILQSCPFEINVVRNPNRAARQRARPAVLIRFFDHQRCKPFQLCRQGSGQPARSGTYNHHIVTRIPFLHTYPLFWLLQNLCRSLVVVDHAILFYFVYI